MLWLLIAHELSPVARQLIRELCTEEVSDPTTDVIRRVVYGEELGEHAWDELGDDGALRRLALIERTDGGDAPEHRQVMLYRTPTRRGLGESRNEEQAHFQMVPR